jgi:hypothetical protein
VTPDGKFVVFVESGPHAKAGASDLLKVALEGAHEITPVVATDAPETAGQVSPDGAGLRLICQSTGSSRSG